MQTSNPMVHWIIFSLIVQNNNESVQNYQIHLWSGAWDCNFICPNCDHDIFNVYIKDQFILGIANEALEMDMLAKEGSLKTLKQNTNHAKTFKMAM